MHFQCSIEFGMSRPSSTDYCTRWSNFMEGKVHCEFFDFHVLAFCSSSFAVQLVIRTVPYTQQHYLTLRIHRYG